MRKNIYAVAAIDNSLCATGLELGAARSYSEDCPCKGPHTVLALLSPEEVPEYARMLSDELSRVTRERDDAISVLRKGRRDAALVELDRMTAERDRLRDALDSEDGHGLKECGSFPCSVCAILNL